MKVEDYIYTNPTSVLCQDMKPNGHEMEENRVLAGLGTSGPTAKSGKL